MSKQYINVPIEAVSDPNLQGKIRLLLYSYITSVTEKGEHRACVASNKWLAEALATTEGNIRKELSALRKLGYVADLPTKQGRKIVAVVGVEQSVLPISNSVLPISNSVLPISNTDYDLQVTKNRGNSNVDSNLNTNCSSNATPSPTTTDGVSAGAADSAILAFQKRFNLSTHPNTIAEIHRQVSARGVSDGEIVNRIRDVLNAAADGALWAGEEIRAAFDSARNADFAAVSLIVN